MPVLPFQIISRLLFPEVCMVCGSAISSAGKNGDRIICRECSTKIRPIRGERCIKCGRPLISAYTICSSCRTKSYLFLSNMPIFEYEGVFKQLFLRYKFGGRKEIGRWLARQAAVFLAAYSQEGPIVPIPGNPKSVRKRGWDQIGNIAGILKKTYGFSVMPILRRKKSVEQKTLGFSERLHNIGGKIEFLRNRPVPAKLVLLDDIFTTGATVQECTRKLLEKGTREVRVVTLAID